jgi:hypothetical protein
MKLTTWLAACALAAVSTVAAAQANQNPKQYAQMNTYEEMVGTPAPGGAMPANGPLTRSQVRADIARARSDGTIPRYGNPDPYGPARMARGAPAFSPLN